MLIKKENNKFEEVILDNNDFKDRELVGVFNNMAYNNECITYEYPGKVVEITGELIRLFKVLKDKSKGKEVYLSVNDFINVGIFYKFHIDELGSFDGYPDAPF